jgi:sulfite exporter TauE/SafE
MNLGIFAAIGLDAAAQAPLIAFCGIVTSVLLFMLGMRKTIQQNQIDDLISTVDYLRKELAIARAELASYRDREDEP